MPPEFNEPLTNMPEGQGIGGPSGAKAAQNMGQFFQDMSKMLQKEGSRQAQQELKEREREVTEQAQKEGVDEGLEAAQEGEGVEQKEGDTLYQRVFNKQAVDAYSDQVYAEFRQKAREVAKENESDLKSFQENFSEMVQGFRERMPTQTQKRMEPVFTRTKSQYEREIEKNVIKETKQENMVSFQNFLRERKKELNALSQQAPENPEARKQLLQSLSGGIAGVAKYGPEDEFEIAGKKFEGGNGLFKNEAELQSTVRELQDYTAKKAIISRFRNLTSAKAQNEFLESYESTISKKPENREDFTLTKYLSPKSEQQLRVDLASEIEKTKEAIDIKKSDLNTKIRRQEEQIKNGVTSDVLDFKSTSMDINTAKKDPDITSTQIADWKRQNQINQKKAQVNKIFKNASDKASLQRNMTKMIDKFSFQAEKTDNKQKKLILNESAEYARNKLEEANEQISSNYLGFMDQQLPSNHEKKPEPIQYTSVNEETGEPVFDPEVLKTSLKERLNKSIFGKEKYEPGPNEYRFFRNNGEKRRFMDRYAEKTIEEKVSFLKTLGSVANESNNQQQKALKSAFGNLSQSEGKRAEMLSHAVAISDLNQSASEKILRGFHLKETEGSNIFEQSPTTIENKVRDNFDGTFAGGPRDPGLINTKETLVDAATNALYFQAAASDKSFEQMNESGWLSQSTVKNVLDKVAGGRKNSSGEMVGGLGRGPNENMVWLPNNMTETEFNETFNVIKRLDLDDDERKMFWKKVSGGNIPVHSNKELFTTNDLRNQNVNFLSVGPGKYKVRIRGQQNIVNKSNAQPFVINFNKIDNFDMKKLKEADKAEAKEVSEQTEASTVLSPTSTFWDLIGE